MCVCVPYLPHTLSIDINICAILVVMCNRRRCSSCVNNQKITDPILLLHGPFFILFFSHFCIYLLSRELSSANSHIIQVNKRSVCRCTQPSYLIWKNSHLITVFSIYKHNSFVRIKEGVRKQEFCFS